MRALRASLIAAAGLQLRGHAAALQSGHAAAALTALGSNTSRWSVRDCWCTVQQQTHSRSFASNDSKQDADKSAAAQQEDGGKPAAVQQDQAPGPSKEPDSAEEEAYEHTHFSRNKNFHRMQGAMEDAERHNAIKGLVRSKWGYLYDNPIERALNQLLWRPIAALRRVLAAPIYSRVAHITEIMIQSDVEGDYDGEEFVEGVEGAVEGIMTTLASRDWGALREMASEAVVEALELSAYQLEAQYGLRLTGVTTRVNQASVSGVSLWGPSSIRLLAPKWMAGVDETTSKSWLVLAVTLDVTLDVELEKTGTGPTAGMAGAGVGGPVKVQVDRRGTWLFARGPLPKGFSRSLYSKWYVLGWW